MKVIDFRCRPPYHEFLSERIYCGYAEEYNRIWGHRSSDILRNQSMNAMITEMDHANIQYGVVGGRPDYGLPNETIVSLVEEYPDRFIGFAGINPYKNGIEKSIELVDRLICNGPLSGLLLEPGFVPNLDESWLADDQAYYPLYEKCEKENIVINFTWGNIGAKNFLDVYNPKIIYHICTDFPNLKLVLSHAGWPYVEETIGLALNHPNLYLSADDVMVPSFPGYQTYVTACNYGLKEQMIFGTCFPIGTELSEAVNIPHQIGVNAEALPYLLYKNAAKILGIAET